MSTPELATELPRGGQSPRRVVEAELKLPRIEDIKLPEIDLEPIRTVAEQVLLTGIGVGVLAIRGLTAAIKAAHQAGAEAAQEPRSVPNALLSLLRKSETPRSGPEKAPPTGPSETRIKVPVLPIDDYDQLAPADILEGLPDLSGDELRLLHAYESDHQARADLLEAIDQQLAES